MQRECSKSASAYGIEYDGTVVEPWWEELKHLVKSGKGHCSVQDWVNDPYQHINVSLDHCKRKMVDDGDGHPERPGPNQGAISNPIAALRIEHYYRKYDGFRHQYEPQEYWCFHCLASREGWELDEGWVPTPELVSTVMEVDSDVEGRSGTHCDACGGSLSDDHGSEEEAASPERGRKRKISEIN
jgi:hypothetical protein